MIPVIKAHQLQDELLKVCDDDIKNQRYKNLKSSLKKVLEAYEFTLDDDIYPLFAGKKLFETLNTVNDYLLTKSLAFDYIKTQLSNIRTSLKDSVDALAIDDSPIAIYKERLRDATVEASSNKKKYFSPISKEIECKLGIENSYVKLIAKVINKRNYHKNGMPVSSDIPAIKIIEKHLDLPRGHLTNPLSVYLKKVNFEKSRVQSVAVEAEQSQFGLKHKKISRISAALRNTKRLSNKADRFLYQLDKLSSSFSDEYYSPEMKNFISDYNAIKTSSTYKMKGHKLPLWKITKGGDLYPSANTRTQTFRGSTLRCASGNAFWRCVGSFYGYLGNPEKADVELLVTYKDKDYFSEDELIYFERRYSGRGISFNDFNIGMLLDSELMSDFIHMLTELDLSPVAKKFLGYLISMVSLDDDSCYFLFSDVARKQSMSYLSFDEKELRSHLNQYLIFLESMLNDTKVKELSSTKRIVSEDLAEVLKLESPLSFLLETEKNIDNDILERRYLPTEFKFVRNKLLYKMMIDNPLRCFSVSCLTIPESSKSGTLRKKVNGGYEYNFTSDHFKNLTAADNNSYVVDFPESLDALLEYYLILRGKILKGEKNSALFISSNRYSEDVLSEDGKKLLKRKNIGKGLSSGLISTSVSNIIYKYAPFRTYKFKGHALRHIVATGYLKDNPESYYVVAQLLHDKLETVIRRYSHDQTDIGLKKHREHMANKRSQLQKAA